MRSFLSLGLCLGVLGSMGSGTAHTQTLAQMPPSSTLGKALTTPHRTTLPALDLQRVAAEDAAAEGKSQPWRYAVGLPVSGVQAAADALQGGDWSTLPDGRLLWRQAVRAEGAQTIDLRFQPYRLPHGAELWVYTPDRKAVAGPYSDQHNNADGIFATPVLPGAEAVIELVVPADRLQRLRLGLERVYSGYRGFDALTGQPIAVAKSGSCNVDTICSDGNNHRSEIQSVVRYSADGGLCTGTLMNNTALDGAPLVLTARHCFATQTAASGMVVYYNYASPTCRTVGSGNNASPLPLSISSHTQTGATLLASSTRADFTLVRLNQAAPSGASPYFAGWDRRTQAPASAVAIHHPAGDEKRISFENDPLSITTSTVNLGGGLILQAGDGLRVNDWDSGTTEQGSSGSAIFSPQKLVVGTLSGGFAACGNNLEDYYGGLFASFAGGGTSATRLSNHLDPTGSGVTTLAGRAPGSGGGGCNLAATIVQNPSTVAVAAGTDVRFIGTISGGTAPYRVSWDVDGDGVIDRERAGVTATSDEILTRYNRAQQTNAILRVSDAAGCQVQVQRAVDVDASALDVPLSGGLTIAQICGNNDNQVDPGEHWRLNVTLNNTGDASTANPVAIFSRSSANEGLRVLRPAVAITGNVAAGQATTLSTEFYIKADTSCSAAHTIQYVGTADDRGVSGQAVNINLPVPNPCTPVTTCPAPAGPGNSFRNGSYFQPSRSGNGLVSFLVPQPNGAPPLFYAQWFTGDDARLGTWYYLLNDMVDGQTRGAIVRRTRNVNAAGFQTSDQVVGTAQVTVLANQQLVFTHQLTGKPRGGDKLVHLLNGLNAPTPNRTGAWFFANESGWGQTYDSFLSNGAATEFVLTYVYDSAGQPRWVTTGNIPANQLSYELLAAPRITCPTCAWVAPDFGAVGSASRTFTGTTTGNLSTNFTVPEGGTWVRNNVPITLLTAPQSEASASTPQAPTASYVYRTEGLTARFVDLSYAADGTLTQKRWSFGDGASSEQSDPVRTYATPGTYNVTLHVTDNDGAVHSLTRVVTVAAGSSTLSAQNCNSLDGSWLLGQDAARTYLGYFGPSSSSESVMNRFSPHGSEFSPASVRNSGGAFGSASAATSALNSSAVNPPYIVKDGRIQGWLTANPAHSAGIALTRIDADACSFSRSVPLRP